MKPVRCAIYTRKSSEEGLEQDFNSLDAQREACAAYVLSQASEGWTQVPETYDDGGLSGGSLERPALQRLLTDIAAGKVDIIVVYKVDRLTRSLLDFAKLVEAFDASGISFVSVTQSFNTTTSMGRLTLNMLLSFAQFEREVTAERIRDKIAASKARGMWMGGTPPLGYEPDGRNGLTVVEEHAAIVRDIYARYLKLGNVRLVAEELEHEGIRAPLRTRRNGATFGGGTFTRGQLYHLLRNPVYAGDIAHKGTIHPGNHAAIIERKLWESVQRKLSDNVQGVRRSREISSALLSGKLLDAAGEPLIPVHSTKPCLEGSKHGRRRYGYYVSRAVHHDAAQAGTGTSRIPAREIEQAVIGQLLQMLADPMGLVAQLELDLHPSQFTQLSARLTELREEIQTGSKRTTRRLLERVVVHADQLELTVSTGPLTQTLQMNEASELPSTVTHQEAIRLTRSGHRLRLVDAHGCAAAPMPDASLTGLIVQARQWWAELARGEIDIATLSRRENVSASWMTRVVRLAFLGPEVVEAIVAGEVRSDVENRAVLATDGVACNWVEQSERFLPVKLKLRA